MNTSVSSPVPLPSGFPAPRVAPNALNALGGVWRLTVRRYFSVKHWLLLLGMFAALGLMSYGSASDSHSVKYFLKWVSQFFICFLSPLIAFITAGGALRDDLKAGTVDYVFTRSVRRPVFVVFRYLTHLICAQFEFLLALGVMLGVGAFFGAEGIADALPRFILAEVLVVTAFSAFGMLAAMITARYVILGLAYGGVIEVGVGQIPTQINRLSMIRQIAGSILRPFMGPVDTSFTALGIPAVIVLALGAAAVTLFAAAALFHVREMAGDASKES